jgi:hypothetical protein
MNAVLQAVAAGILSFDEGEQMCSMLNNYAEPVVEHADLEREVKGETVNDKKHIGAQSELTARAWLLSAGYEVFPQRQCPRSGGYRRHERRYLPPIRRQDERRRRAGVDGGTGNACRPAEHPRFELSACLEASRRDGRPYGSG